MSQLVKSALYLVWALTSTLGLDPWENELIEREPDWSKSKNGFSAMLLLSDNPEDVMRSWATPNANVPIHTVDTIARGVPIVAFVFFSGCRADENGLCNASADFTILKPDGSVYESFSDLDLWKLKPTPPGGTLRLSAEYVGAVIEAEDPLGLYEFHVSVHDLNSGTSLELTQSFNATAGSRVRARSKGF